MMVHSGSFSLPQALTNGVPADHSHTIPPSLLPPPPARPPFSRLPYPPPPVPPPRRKRCYRPAAGGANVGVVRDRRTPPPWGALVLLLLVSVEKLWKYFAQECLSTNNICEVLNSESPSRLSLVAEPSPLGELRMVCLTQTWQEGGKKQANKRTKARTSEQRKQAMKEDRQAGRKEGRKDGDETRPLIAVRQHSPTAQKKKSRGRVYARSLRGQRESGYKQSYDM